MNDQDFLMWIYDRLILMHSENIHSDYMQRLRSIAEQASAENMDPRCQKIEIEQ